MAEVYFFSEEGLTGANPLHLTTDDDNLTNNNLDINNWFDSDWNDEISSMHVISGTVTVYQDVGYHGDHRDFGPGVYNTLGVWNDHISSVDLWG